MKRINLSSLIELMKRMNLGPLKEFLNHYILGLIKRVDERHIILLGGGLAFSLFLCIIPFVLIIFSILGSILESSALETQIDAAIDRIIPYGNYATFVKTFLYQRIEEFKAYRGVAGLVGAVGLLLAASGLFSSLRTVLNSIYRFGRSQHVLLGKLKDLGMVILVVFFFLVATLLFPLLDILREMASRLELLKYLRFGQEENFLISIFSVVIIFFLFFVLYYLIPYARLGFKVPAVSAFWATLFWETARRLFGYYITNMANLKQIYGLYVFVVVVALWVFYSCIIFIIGAEIGQLYREKRIGPRDLATG